MASPPLKVPGSSSSSVPKAAQYPSSAIMMKEAAGDPGSRRPRTTSEGTPLGLGRRGVVNAGVSGSPLSPSPGSYIRFE